MHRLATVGFICTLIVSAWAAAGEAHVVSAKAAREAAGSYRFTVTVRHDDEGWNHYANEWQGVGIDGTVYGTRTLYHPHVDEQPFTRSLSGVRIPPGVESVIIRAGDSVHGYGGESVTVELP